MDSVTQITLGAAVGEAVLGRQLGNRAIYWGAFFGTLPDLDAIFSPLFDSVQFIVYHRGLSHSLFAVALLSPLFTAAFHRWYRGGISRRHWLWFFFLVLLTHILLDCCTTYGTQLFLPFSDRRIAWNIVFIIDPLYTLPFLSCVFACLFLRPDSRWRRGLNVAGLILSTGYLLMAFAIQQHVKQTFANALVEQNIAAKRMMVCPTAFNTILWFGIAEEQAGYRLGFYSLLDSDDDITFQAVPRHSERLGDLIHTYEVNRLIWFADGYYSVRQDADGVILDVLKFGKMNLLDEEPQYAFSYRIRQGNPSVRIEPYEAPRTQSLEELLARLWQRIQGDKSAE